VEMYIEIDNATLCLKSVIKLIADRTGLAICPESSFRGKNTCDDYVGMYSNNEGKIYRGVLLKGQGGGEKICITLHRIA